MVRARPRPSRLLGLAAPLLAGSLVLFGAPPAAAEENGGGGGGGAIGGGGITAWTFAYHAIGGGEGTRIPCEVEGVPTIPEEMADQVPEGWEMPATIPGHIEFRTTGGGALPDIIVEQMNEEAVGGTNYLVLCVPDDEFIELLPPGIFSLFMGWLFALINFLIDQNFQDIAFVPDGGPQMSLDAALAMLGLGTPTIVTSPSQDVGGSIVAMDTWFAIDPAIWHDYGTTLSSTAAGVTVTADIYASPTKLSFTTGDGGFVECTALGPGPQYGGNPDAPHCGHVYQQASTGYPITATVTYHGGYTTSVGGGEEADIEREGDATLTVTHAEAIVTD
ncbi:MAG: hypothetical protein ACRD29_10645 [Acidimicrobiales bacterium]